MLYRDTYSYFTQVDPIIQRVPGTLFVVGPPGLFKNLINTLAFLTLQPVTTRDARCSRDAIGSRITFSARGACRSLHASAILENLKKKRACRHEGWQWKEANNICTAYCYLTSCFKFSLSSLGGNFLFGLHATQTPECCHSSNHHTQEAKLYLINRSYKQTQCHGAEMSAKTNVVQTKAKQQNQHTTKPWSKWMTEHVLMRN